MITYTVQLTVWCFHWRIGSCSKGCPFSRFPWQSLTHFAMFSGEIISRVAFDQTSHIVFRISMRLYIKLRHWPLPVRAWHSTRSKITSSSAYNVIPKTLRTILRQTRGEFSDNCKECSSKIARVLSFNVFYNAWLVFKVYDLMMGYQKSAVI